MWNCILFEFVIAGFAMPFWLTIHNGNANAGIILQTGKHNDSDLMQNGNGNIAVVAQSSNANKTKVHQDGSGNITIVTQD